MTEILIKVDTFDDFSNSLLMSEVIAPTCLLSSPIFSLENNKVSITFVESHLRFDWPVFDGIICAIWYSFVSDCMWWAYGAF